MPNIRLSPKHGLNPTIPVCFFCGKQKNEIALLGKIDRKETTHTVWGSQNTHVVEHDIEAPKNCFLDYIPCDECKAAMAQGVTFIAVTTTKPDDNRPPIQTDKAHNTSLYPTGKFVVVTEDAARRILTPDAADNVISKKACFLDEPAFEQLFGGLNAENREDEA